ncbi:hypothetical protein [Desulfovibrio psychrotolerans]|uniref:Flagellar motor switch protein FliG middle domain-containing protein n=1 Tax=Desulfovibrio psychrotolerans TaxID=415242 RepID=A0A7J0BVJ7_9BACT|nr:hypothetical protein [Desulfovibrio psychrotolerans]GFM37201.1 hypothetical protein DSM19430T_18850 [Desulfovibrio psychrotolerans]
MKRKRQGRKVIQLFGARGGVKPGSGASGEDAPARPHGQKQGVPQHNASAHGHSAQSSQSGQFSQSGQSVLDGADMDDLFHQLSMMATPDAPEFEPWPDMQGAVPPSGTGEAGHPPDARTVNRAESTGRRVMPDGFAFPALDRMAARMASAMARRLHSLSTRRWQVLPATARRVRFAAWSRFSASLTATVQMLPLEGVALLGADAPLTHLLATRLLDRGPERRFADPLPVSAIPSVTSPAPMPEKGPGHGPDSGNTQDNPSGVTPHIPSAIPEDIRPVVEPPPLPRSLQSESSHASPNTSLGTVQAVHDGAAHAATSVQAVAAYCLHAFQLDWEWAMAPYFEVETVRCRLIGPGEPVVELGELAELDEPGESGDVGDVGEAGEEDECVLVTFAVSDGERSGRMLLLFPLTMLRPLGAMLAEPARLLMPSYTETDDEAFARLRSLDDAALAAELRTAHPLLAAVVLFRMADERRGRVLQLLEPAMREELVRRMGRRASMLRTLSVEQRTVVRTLLLGETHAAHVLRMCTPEAAARFLSLVATLPSLFPAQASQILAEGAPGMMCSTPLVVDSGMVTRLLMRSFTPAEAAKVRARLKSGGYALPFNCLRRCTPSGIADLLRMECLGGAALVLRHLLRIDPGLAAEVFSLLDETMRPGILERVAQPRSIAADVLHAVENALCRELFRCGSWEYGRSERDAGDVTPGNPVQEKHTGRAAGGGLAQNRQAEQEQNGQEQNEQEQNGKEQSRQEQDGRPEYAVRAAHAVRAAPAGTAQSRAASGVAGSNPCPDCPEGSASDACLLMAALPADERGRLAERLTQAGVALPADCLPFQQ